MKKFLLGMAVSVILMLFMGCAIIGKDFDSDKAKQIKIGVTTRGDIERVFGKPFKTGVQNGHPIWVYEYNYYHTLGDDESRDLIIVFDDTGKVRSFQVMSNSPYS